MKSSPAPPYRGMRGDERVDPPQVCGEGRMIDYPECPNCQRYVEAAFQDAIEFSKFRTMLQIADDRMTSLVAENAKLREEIERERKAHLELTASYHDATEEIGRLERALELQKQASRDVAATYTEQETEIERLEHMQSNLHGHIKRLEDENAKLQRGQFTWENNKKLTAENAKLRAALRNIADPNTDYEAGIEIARAALQKDEGK